MTPSDTVQITSGEDRQVREYRYGSADEATSQFWGWVAESIVFYKGDGGSQGMRITHNGRAIRIGRFDSGQLDCSQTLDGNTVLLSGTECRDIVVEHRPHLIGRR
jgi:hypothetical protein